MRKRTNFTVLLSVFILLVFAGLSYGFGGCEQNCSNCHSLDKKEAQELLKQLIPDIKIIEVQMAPARGLWEVALETKDKKKGIAYIDFAKENVIVGEILKIKTRTNLTRERYMEINRIDFSQIPLDNALVMGNPDAKRKIVVFDDPD